MIPDIEKLAEPLGLMLQPAVPVQTNTVTLAVLADAADPVTAIVAATVATTKSLRTRRMVAVLSPEGLVPDGTSLRLPAIRRFAYGAEHEMCFVSNRAVRR